MAWSGLGVNYKAAQANWASDAAYFKSIGVTGIRVNMASISGGWTPPGNITAGSYEFWRSCAAFFASQGFWVSWGPANLSGFTTAGSLTSGQWPTFHDSVVADAKYMQAQGIALGAYELGNELDNVIDGSTITTAQLITNLKQLATDVKAVYTLSPIAYSTFDRNGNTYSAWVAAGLGNIDLFGLHPYGNVTAQSNSFTDGGFPSLATMFNAFGSKCYVSEFNIDANNANILAAPAEVRVNTMRRFYRWIRSTPAPHAMVYSWVGYLNTDNQFAMQNMDGSFNDYWDVLLNDNRRRTLVN